MKKITEQVFFHIAWENGHNNTVQLLLDNGININFCQYNGANPIYITFENGYGNTVQLYLDNSTKINLCKVTELILFI